MVREIPAFHQDATGIGLRLDMLSIHFNDDP